MLSPKNIPCSYSIALAELYDSIANLRFKHFDQFTRINFFDQSIQTLSIKAKGIRR